MCARFLSALALMILLSVAGTAMAEMQPTAASNQHGQDQGLPNPAEHGQRDHKSVGDSNDDAQGNDNQGDDDQGDDNGQHKDKGHHYGKSGTGNGEEGEHSGKGNHPTSGSNGNGGKGGSGTGVGTGTGIGPPKGGAGATGSTGGSVGVPEPATLALLGLGLLGCAVRARRR